MKYLLSTVLSLILFSCSIQKKESKNRIMQLQEQLKVTSEILFEENNIVNDFLQIELTSEKYKSMENLEIVLIEEAKNRIANLDAYEYAYKDWHSYNLATPDDNARLGWILDSIQIRELRSTYMNDDEYHWKSSDIKNYKVTIMKHDSLTNIIKSGSYTEKPEKLILYISRPLIINKNNAFISFASGSSRFGFGEITHLTLLMKKVNEKWVEGPGYDDGVLH